MEFEVRFGAELGLSVGFDGAPGDSTTTRFNTGVTMTSPAGERGSLELGYDFDLSSYDFSGATGLIPGTDDPWGEVLQHRFSARYSRFVSRQWAWMLGGGVGWAGEQDADPGDSLFGHGFFALRYAISESLLVGFGGGFRTKIEDDPYLIPFFLVRWQLSDALLLSNEGRLGLTLTYALDKAWTLALAGEWDYLDFRLDDDGPVPNAVVRDNRYPMSFGVRWRPSELLYFSLTGGLDVGRSLTVEDGDGIKVSETDLDPSPFVALTMKLHF